MRETYECYHNKSTQVLNHNYIVQYSVISFFSAFLLYSLLTLAHSIYGSFNLSSSVAIEKESSMPFYIR